MTANDPLYEAVSEGRRFAGMEHWLPFFYERLETLFDYLPEAPVVIDYHVEEAIARAARPGAGPLQARREAANAGADRRRRALQADRARCALSSRAAAGRRRSADRNHAQLSPFVDAGGGAALPSTSAGGTGRTFAAERAADDVNVFDALIAHIDRPEAVRPEGRDRLVEQRRARPAGPGLADHGLGDLKPVETYAELQALPEDATGLAVLPLESGFETPDFAIIGDQDVLGDRLVRDRPQAQARRRGADARSRASPPAISSSMSTTASAASWA